MVKFNSGYWFKVVGLTRGANLTGEQVLEKIGVNYKFENNLYLVGQGYYQEGRVDGKSDIKAVNLHFDKPVFNFNTIETNIMYEFETKTYIIQPQFTYFLANSTEL